MNAKRAGDFMNTIKKIIYSKIFKTYKIIMFVIYSFLAILFYLPPMELGIEPIIYYILLGTCPCVLIIIFYHKKNDMLTNFIIIYDFIIFLLFIIGLFILTNYLAYFVLFPLILTSVLESIIFLFYIIKESRNNSR